MTDAAKVAVIGCIHPAERIRAITSLTLIGAPHGTVITPKPPASPALVASAVVIVTPAAAARPPASAVVTATPSANAPEESEGAQEAASAPGASVPVAVDRVWFVDEEHREQYPAVSQSTSCMAVDMLTQPLAYSRSDAQYLCQ